MTEPLYPAQICKDCANTNGADLETNISRWTVLECDVCHKGARTTSPEMFFKMCPQCERVARLTYFDYDHTQNKWHDYCIDCGEV